MSKRRDPLNVVVTWDDACDRNLTCGWDGTIDAVAKLAETAPLYKNRQTVGFLVYVNEEALWLAHDYDRDEGEVGKLVIIPLGWIVDVRSGRRVLFHR